MTTYTYSVDGMLRREVAPAGAITTSVWDSDGMPWYIVYPLRQKVNALLGGPVFRKPGSELRSEVPSLHRAA
ncbi:MAG: hypothetical protein ACKV0T_01930 [Planctomycetales bacterium]